MEIIHAVFQSEVLKSAPFKKWTKYSREFRIFRPHPGESQPGVPVREEDSSLQRQTLRGRKAQGHAEGSQRPSSISARPHSPG